MRRTKNKTAAKLALTSIVWFVLGFTCWVIDRNFCHYLQVFPYLHSFWHVFVCLGKLENFLKIFRIFEISDFFKRPFRWVPFNCFRCFLLCRVQSTRVKAYDRILARLRTYEVCRHSLCDGQSY